MTQVYVNIFSKEYKEIYASNARIAVLQFLIAIIRTALLKYNLRY